MVSVVTGIETSNVPLSRKLQKEFRNFTDIFQLLGTGIFPSILITMIVISSCCWVSLV